MSKIWECKIGECESVPHGADLPMRGAVEHAYRTLTGKEPVFLFSGWGAELSEPERAVVENREPSAAHEKEWHERNAPLSQIATPASRSTAALPENIRRTLEDSDLDISVAIAIADHLDTIEAERNRVVETHKGLMQAVEAERDAALRDAERYRWLRSYGRVAAESDPWVVSWDQSREGCENESTYGPIYEEELDAAIDAARASGSGS